MPIDQVGRVVELVVFTLKAGVTREELVDTVDGVSRWAEAQSGFVSRDLAYSAAENRWIDVVWWDSRADAEAAAAAAMSSEACAPMVALIDSESILMLHGVPVAAPVPR